MRGRAAPGDWARCLAGSPRFPATSGATTIPHRRMVTTDQPVLSIVVPALDEASSIGPSLEALRSLRARGAEVIVSDGGSRDATRAIAAPLADRVVESPRGRAVQMNAG